MLPDADLTVHGPPELAGLASDDVGDRVAHGHGQAFRNVVRVMLGRVDHVPDLVLRPRSEQDVVDVLDWCAGIAVVPFGGGTSVVGGVEPRCAGDHPGVVSLDLGRLDRIVEVDRVSRAARHRPITSRR